MVEYAMSSAQADPTKVQKEYARSATPLAAAATAVHTQTAPPAQLLSS